VVNDQQLRAGRRRRTDRRQAPVNGKRDAGNALTRPCDLKAVIRNIVKRREIERPVEPVDNPFKFHGSIIA
jgi:hypothetical protein